MKVRDLVVAQESLQRLLSLDLPAAVSFQVARAARPIQAELQGYERQRVNLVRRYGEDTGRGQIMVLPQKSAEFDDEMNALLDVDVELEFESIDPAILNEDGVRVKPADLMALWFLFEGRDE